jgi:hypothetical protein
MISLRSAGKIINILRVDPQCPVDNLLDDDVGPLMERLLAAPDDAAERAVIVQFLHAVYLECATLLGAEHRERITAGLEAAQERAQVDVAIQEVREAGEMLTDLHNRIGDLAGQLSRGAQDCFRVVTEHSIRLHQDQQRAAASVTL